MAKTHPLQNAGEFFFGSETLPHTQNHNRGSLSGLVQKLVSDSSKMKRGRHLQERGERHPAHKSGDGGGFEDPPERPGHHGDRPDVHEAQHRRLEHMGHEAVAGHGACARGRAGGVLGSGPAGTRPGGNLGRFPQAKVQPQPS